MKRGISGNPIFLTSCIRVSSAFHPWLKIMIAFLSHFRAARLFLRCQPYVELPGDFWTGEDAAAWLAFRQTLAGRKLGAILANQVVRSAVSATAAPDPAQSAHQCGYASGIRGTVTILDSLLPAAILNQNPS